MAITAIGTRWPQRQVQQCLSLTSRSRDAAEWTTADVREFIEFILPGHPCVDFFKYTSGYVLCSLDKEDIQRQAKSEDAANAIWTELQGCRKKPMAVSPRGARSPQELAVRSADETAPAVARKIVYVRVPRGQALEFEVDPLDTVASLKAQFAAHVGIPAAGLRLAFRGLNMQDDRTIGSYNLHQGAVILLVPHLREPGNMLMTLSPPRGVIMVPGGVKWQPSQTCRPFMPVVFSDVFHRFPVSLEFDTADDLEAFMTAAKEEPPMLEIMNGKAVGVALETKVHLDLENSVVSLPSGGYSLTADTRYEAFAHFGGRGGNVKVILETGAGAP